MTTGLKLHSKRPLIFLGVGVINTALDFTFYTLLTSFIFTDASSIALAGFISGTFALTCAFLTHGYITFRGSNLGRKELVKFVIFTGFGMWVLRPLLLAIFIHLETFYQWMHMITNTIGLPFSYSFIANTGAFGFMLVIVLTYNYYIYSHYVFTSAHTEPESR